MTTSSQASWPCQHRLGAWFGRALGRVDLLPPGLAGVDASWPLPMITHAPRRSSSLRDQHSLQCLRPESLPLSSCWTLDPTQCGLEHCYCSSRYSHWAEGAQVPERDLPLLLFIICIMFIRDIGLKFSSLVVSLSCLGMRVILTLKISLEIFLLLLFFGKGLRIGVSFSLNVW